MKLGVLHQLAKAIPSFEQADFQAQFQKKILELGLDPNALYQELEMTSSYVDTHRDISYSNDHMQVHSHTFFELIYCCNNCGAEYLVGSDRYRLQAGDVIFVPPGVSHRPLLPENLSAPYERYVLWLSMEFMEQYASLFPYAFSEKQAASSLLRTSGTPWEKSLKALFQAGVEETQGQQDGWEAAVIGNAISLLTQIKRATDQVARKLKAEKPELLDKIMAYVENHYAEQLRIDEVSKALFVSSSTVSHLFKEKMGVSFYRYVSQRRLIAAKTLIEKGELLENVATLTGFGDYSGFYRAFRQEYGITPRQYRNLQDTPQVK